MISFLAPMLSVVFGVTIVLLYSKSKPLNLKLFLAFSGAFLLSTTIFELLPEVYANLETKKIGLFIMGGILLQILLEFYSKGAEHGHLHQHDAKTVFPWFLFISLGIHAFFEGFPLKDHHKYYHRRSHSQNSNCDSNYHLPSKVKTTKVKDCSVFNYIHTYDAFRLYFG